MLQSPKELSVNEILREAPLKAVCLKLDGSENTPYINCGKGDTLAQRTVSLPHRRVRGKLVRVWKKGKKNAAAKIFAWTLLKANVKYRPKYHQKMACFNNLLNIRVDLQLDCPADEPGIGPCQAPIKP
eukprot:1158902-Pelagomonas_calceolata.AAC.9